jgi:hypothetical protein
MRWSAVPSFHEAEFDACVTRVAKLYAAEVKAEVSKSEDAGRRPGIYGVVSNLRVDAHVEYVDARWGHEVPMRVPTLPIRGPHMMVGG